MRNPSSLLDIVSAILRQESRGDLINSATLPEILPLLSAARDLLATEPARLKLTGEYAIVGDIHGNLASLLRIFGRLGYPPYRSYLFLGDYVDRGPSSCGVIFLLLCLKLLYPEHIFLLRGNHESRDMTATYGFFEECTTAFSTAAYEATLECFTEMPVCAIVNQIVFCVHGGIPWLQTDFEKLAKPTGEDYGPIIGDLLWSDPSREVTGFRMSERGRGHLFGPMTVQNFLETARVALVIRSHEMCPRGYDYPFGQDGGIMTVFSSCDYCEMKNDAAVAIVRRHETVMECFEPLTEQEERLYRVIFPYWVICHVTAVQIDILQEIEELQTITPVVTI
jgi:hypothetical protein